MRTALIDADVAPKGYELYKEIDGNWKVWSHHSNRTLKSHIGPNGYIYYAFGNTKKYLHRLVCRMYWGPSDGLQCNHIDGDRLNNDPNNLEWVTAAENNLHAHTLLTRKKVGSYRHPNCFLSDNQIMAIYNSTGTERSVAEEFRTSARTVRNIRSGLRHSRVTGRQVQHDTNSSNRR